MYTTSISCVYCERPIETEADGWGYFLEGTMIPFHTECAEIFEEIKV